MKRVKICEKPFQKAIYARGIQKKRESYQRGAFLKCSYTEILKNVEKALLDTVSWKIGFFDFFVSSHKAAPHLLSRIFKLDIFDMKKVLS